MRFLTVSLLIAFFGLSACSSNWNPVNWFGSSKEVAVESSTAANPLIPVKTGMFSRPDEEYPGIPVAKVTELKVERVANGALIRATGVAYVQGAFNVRLVPQNDGIPVSGVLTFEMQAVHPRRSTSAGSEKTREVIVAYRMTDQQLQGVRSIKVAATENARQSRR